MKSVKKYKEFIKEGWFSKDKETTESLIFDELKKRVIEKRVTIYFLVSDVYVEPKVRKITNLSIETLNYVINIDFEKKKAIYESKELDFDRTIDEACEIMRYYDIDATDGRLYKLMGCKQPNEKQKDEYWNEMIEKNKGNDFVEKIYEYCKKFYLVSVDFFKKNNDITQKMNINSLFED